VEKTYSIRHNADGTITVKVGRAKEHITTEGKDRGEIFDAVKWMLISKGVNLLDTTITQDLIDQLWST